MEIKYNEEGIPFYQGEISLNCGHKKFNAEIFLTEIKEDLNSIEELNVTGGFTEIICDRKTGEQTIIITINTSPKSEEK